MGQVPWCLDSVLSPLSVLCLQDSGVGHDLVEDTRAAMELYRTTGESREMVRRGE